MKKLLLSIMAICPIASQAQNATEWAVVEPLSGRTVLMSSVGFLLASDADDTFAVVCNDGTVIDGATSVSFKQVDPTVIRTAAADGGTSLLDGGVDGMLRLTGCAGGTQIDVFDGGGRRVRSVVAGSGSVTVDVSGLPAGVYVLRAGRAAVKFMKK